MSTILYFDYKATRDGKTRGSAVPSLKIFGVRASLGFSAVFSEAKSVGADIHVFAMFENSLFSFFIVKDTPNLAGTQWIACSWGFDSYNISDQIK